MHDAIDDLSLYSLKIREFHRLLEQAGMHVECRPDGYRLFAGHQVLLRAAPDGSPLTLTQIAEFVARRLP